MNVALSLLVHDVAHKMGWDLSGDPASEQTEFVFSVDDKYVVRFSTDESEAYSVIQCEILNVKLVRVIIEPLLLFNKVAALSDGVFFAVHEDGEHLAFFKRERLAGYDLQTFIGDIERVLHVADLWSKILMELESNKPQPPEQQPTIQAIA